MIILNGITLNFNKFPNGELKVDGSEVNKYTYGVNHIMFKYEDDTDLIKLMFIKKHLDESNVRTNLTIAYMPYSRMDRAEGESVFTLKYVSEFINSLNFEKVTVIEPHSDVSTALLNRAKPHYPTSTLFSEVIKDIEFDKNKDYLFFPDAGAQKRYSKLVGFKQLVGFKKRDFETGNILSNDVVGLSESLEGKKIIIVDDLCSKGGTYHGIDDKGKEFGCAYDLKKLGASEIYLLITHCEDTIFNGHIFKGDIIDKVFTTNTILKDSVSTRVFADQLTIYKNFLI